MANFKRGKCRYHGVASHSSRGHWLRHWPRWWDYIYHTRPRRVAEKRLEVGILSGRIDADDTAWPVERKPHHYYW